MSHATWASNPNPLQTPISVKHLNLLQIVFNHYYSLLMEAKIPGILSMSPMINNWTRDDCRAAFDEISRFVESDKYMDIRADIKFHQNEKCLFVQARLLVEMDEGLIPIEARVIELINALGYWYPAMLDKSIMWDEDNEDDEAA